MGRGETTRVQLAGTRSRAGAGAFASIVCLCSSLTIAQVVAETMELMRWHRDTLRENWKLLDVENIQARWCVVVLSSQMIECRRFAQVLRRVP